jgi:hypothetical protein
VQSLPSVSFSWFKFEIRYFLFARKERDKEKRKFKAVAHEIFASLKYALNAFSQQRAFPSAPTNRAHPSSMKPVQTYPQPHIKAVI